MVKEREPKRSDETPSTGLTEIRPHEQQPSTEVGLSAIVVIYNEARYLPACLERLRFCDEILVVDLGSEDGGGDLARRLGARVIEHPWVPFAEKVWPVAVREARWDWIVFSDPDMLYPEGVGERIREMIRRYEPDELSAILLPLVTCVGGVALRRGQKGETRSFRAVVNRRRYRFLGLLHRRGIEPVGKTVELGLLRRGGEAILHLWIDGLRDAVEKARRYLPHEAESRLATGKTFRWRDCLGEMLESLKLDLRLLAPLDWRATQIMLFNLWYIWKANMALRKASHDRG